MAANRLLTPAQEKAVRKAYEKGASTSELAEQYGVHKDTIRTSVVRAGGTLRPRGAVKSTKSTRGARKAAPAKRAKSASAKSNVASLDAARKTSPRKKATARKTTKRAAASST